jgi:hypothetical protein
VLYLLNLKIKLNYILFKLLNLKALLKLKNTSISNSKMENKELDF